LELRIDVDPTVDVAEALLKKYIRPEVSGAADFWMKGEATVSLSVIPEHGFTWDNNKNRWDNIENRSDNADQR
jgi:hypothetical protein